MATMVMDNLIVGQAYYIRDLAVLWGYQSPKAISRGIVTPKQDNKIVLFVTERKTASSVPYEDSITGDILNLSGERGHVSDNRIISNLHEHKDEFHLFVRDKHGNPYTYLGQCFLIGGTIYEEKPSQFKFLIQEPESGFEDEDSLMDYLSNAESLTGTSSGLVIEGKVKIAQHIRYERNPENRRAAIEEQGYICKICGFDFNSVYGADLADSYIEVHHIKPLSAGEQAVDPKKDLIPVCANCHRMLHRHKKENISVPELKQRIAKQGHLQGQSNT